MDSNPFAFNIDASYQPGAQDTSTGGATLSAPALTKPQIQVAQGKWFEEQYPNVFEKYRLPLVSSGKLVQAWRSSPMQFWQNQLNFAVWCASTGCGVSLEDHFTAADALMQSVYRFHIYYQVRRILGELQTPLPQDQAWHAMNNPYDRRGYERICNEFGVSPQSDWRVSGPNRGLGRVYNYWSNSDYHPIGDGEYDASRMSFTKRTTNSSLHVDFIKQDAHNADTAWGAFMLNKSDGFTRAGVERLNDSIRTYVWAILGAQAQTRSAILGSGTSFDAQKQFLVNVEDAISSPVDIPSAIERYQSVLQNASSKVDYVFGTGLYMAPSDMRLHIGTVSGYNNQIVIAPIGQPLGVSSDINGTPVPAPVETGEAGLVVPRQSRTHDKPDTSGVTTTTHSVAPPSNPPVAKQQQTQKAQDHEDEKTALVAAGVLLGLVSLWQMRR